ncbi:MAG: hypothetical protein ACK481_06440 [Candidatus Melainabacteria bacterium]|jgi:Flp pilus assembly protein CpaB
MIGQNMMHKSTVRPRGRSNTGFVAGIGVLIGFALIALFLGGLAIYLREGAKIKEAELRKTVPVVSAAVDLPAGTVITTQDIMLKQVTPNSKEPGAFEDLSDPALIGGTLKVEVLGGQTILRSYIGSSEQK